MIQDHICVQADAHSITPAQDWTGVMFDMQKPAAMHVALQFDLDPQKTPSPSLLRGKEARRAPNREHDKNALPDLVPHAPEHALDHVMQSMGARHRAVARAGSLKVVLNELLTKNSQNKGAGRVGVGHVIKLPDYEIITSGDIISPITETER